MFDRGFTGHEHLYNFSLINMNGRMYDPVMESKYLKSNHGKEKDLSPPLPGNAAISFLV